MIVRSIFFTLCLATRALGQDAAVIAYIGVENDPFYEPQPVYTGLSLKDRARPLPGAELAVRSARVLARTLGVAFTLETQLVPPGSAAAAVARAEAEGALAVLLDLPEPELAALPKGGGLRFNIRLRQDRLRGAECHAGMLHTIPRDAMLADALAQHLRAKGWDRVLLLAGQSAEDKVRVAAAQRAISKFGLTLVDARGFVLTNDPRRRDLSIVALLTGVVRHDVIWLIDSDGEFGRYVPYDTFEARPVVGSEGLTPVAWHWTYERHGAPQLNQRFRRAADRDMEALDWAAWAAVRSVVESVQRTGSIEPATVADFLTSPRLSLDLYKGVSGSYRRWNGQLRQPVLLATHNAVIAVTPLEGFEHQRHTLDTLGVDESESACQY